MSSCDYGVVLAWNIKCIGEHLKLISTTRHKHVLIIKIYYITLNTSPSHPDPLSGS